MKTCYFEDACVGYRTEAHAYTISSDAIKAFANEWDPMPFHTDEAAAKESIYQGLTASGAHVYAIFVKLAHMQERKMAVIAALGIKDMRFIAPVRPGDTLSMKGHCIEARASQSKDDRGICEFEFTLINQHNETVLQLTQPLMLAKKSSDFSLFSQA